MYGNSRHLKDREIKLRVDEATYNLIEALAMFNKTQKAVLIRDIVESALEQIVNDTEKTNVA